MIALAVVFRTFFKNKKPFSTGRAFAKNIYYK
jgi:hypothetical protein